MDGTALPRLRAEVPGPASRAWVDRLAARECPAVTARRARRAAALGAADTDPIVWVEAVGANVRDADGNVFVDLCGGFGVATVGHRHPAVVAAATAQAGALVHAMGDAFPDTRRIELMERLCAITGMDRVILGTSGSDAVEAAIKTAWLATGRRRVLAFEGGYHGLASAPLAAIGYHRDDFRGPFAGMLGQHVDVAPFGTVPDLRGYAAVLVEPIQGRGGMRPVDLAPIHAAARAAGALVIHDEIYSGVGRTGAWLATDLKPDVLCLGKALGGGFPISACLGTAAVMDAWGASKGEAIHTQTFLGHPVGCAAALAVLDVVPALMPRAAVLERLLGPATGKGAMLGVPVPNALAVSRRLLAKGWIVLPCGERGEALGLTPPLTMTDEQAEGFVAALRESVDGAGETPAP
ncbi:MAG: aminotransferase class III-fold pyridoxal phosphate-dependent enzyme, partial [Myxococcota bacterium]